NTRDAECVVRLDVRLGVGQQDIAESGAGTEGNVRTSVIPVIALDTLVHGTESAADHGLATSRHIIGESDTRTDSSPVIVYQTFGYAIFAVNANAVQVELN